jgi:hypothetical protein
MHWIHRQRQGWLVVGLGAALLGGCGADQGAGFGPEPAVPADGLARRAGPPPALDDAAGLLPPRAIGDAMPLLPGENMSRMPVARPEEQAVALPGTSPRLKK